METVQTGLPEKKSTRQSRSADTGSIGSETKSVQY